MPKTSAEAAGAQAKDAVNYRVGDPQGMSCGSCMNFRPEMLMCSKVRGEISPSGLCDLYESAREGEVPPGEPAAPVDQALLDEMLFGGGLA